MQNLWIFQINRNLDFSEADQLTAYLQTKLSEWKAHGKTITHRMAVLHGRFVVINAVSDPSGCSVDWLNSAVESCLARVASVSEDHSRICFRSSKGIESLHFMELIDAVRAGQLSPQTVIFDNTVVHRGTMADWEKPVAESWLAPRINASV